MKRGRSIGSKYKNLQTRKEVKRKNNSNEDVETLKELSDIIDFLSSRKIDQVPEIYENKEILFLTYIYITDNLFTYK
jgi:hypothetical protein